MYYEMTLLPNNQLSLHQLHLHVMEFLYTYVTRRINTTSLNCNFTIYLLYINQNNLSEFGDVKVCLDNLDGLLSHLFKHMY